MKLEMNNKWECQREFRRYWSGLKVMGARPDLKTEWTNFLQWNIADGNLPADAITWKLSWLWRWI